MTTRGSKVHASLGVSALGASALGVYALAVLLTLGCNKAKDESPPPLGVTAEPAAVAPSAAASQAAPAVSIPEPIAAIPMPIPAPAAAPAAAAGAAKAAGTGGAATGNAASSFKACCAALHKEADSASGADQGKLKQAAMTCDGIAGIVASGKTSTKDGYTAVRAALRGAPLPAGCK